MSALDHIASAQNIKSEEPNIALAEKIAAAKDKKAVKELMDGLAHKNKDIQSDCIKVLYEAGERNPGLIAPYKDQFLALLSSKNNRLQWGAMTALDALSAEDPEGIYAVLPKIIDAANSGSVITRDHAVGILIKLLAQKEYADKIFPLLKEQLMTCPTNQLPMYAENAMGSISAKHKAAFIAILSSRLDEMDKESKRKRIEKVMKKISPA